MSLNVGASSCNQQVAGLVPGWGTDLGCGFIPTPGVGARDPSQDTYDPAQVPGLAVYEGN